MIVGFFVDEVFFKSDLYIFKGGEYKGLRGDLLGQQSSVTDRLSFTQKSLGVILVVSLPFVSRTTPKSNIFHIPMPILAFYQSYGE